MSNIPAVITGTGSYTPARVLTNSDFERMVDTSDEWIRTRTGIRERRIKEDGIGSSDLAVEAGKKALARAGLEPSDLDLLIVGTVTPDYPVPATSCFVQRKLGAFNAAAMDVGAACSSFMYGLSTATAYVKSGFRKRVLVIGVESLSSLTNYADRSTCVLFGDGAGAVVVEAGENGGKQGVLGFALHADGRHTGLLWVPLGGSVNPIRSGNVDQGRFFIEMNGNEVFKIAVRAMVSASAEVCKTAGVSVDDISLFIPHQANIRIIDAVQKRIGISSDKVFVNIEKYGNTSSASVPLALDEAFCAGRIKKGDLVLMVAFGGGLTWGAALVRF